MPNHIAPSLIIDGTLYTLLAFSVATWTVILFKSWQFTNNNYRNRRFNQAFWNAPDLAQAASVPANTALGPQARIARRGFAWLNESRHNNDKQLKYIGSPSELLGHLLQVQMQQEQHRMERGLTLLASIGSTSPFVGLFGTVLGIMHAMHEITASGSTSLDVVAGPIGDALVATAIGIAVAVPAVLAYNFFVRRAKQQRAGLENFVISFLHVALNSNDNTENKHGF
ncbi:MotA/TolQ/ExbB proton channel family protein [Candidatus Methylobacter oryzae]|uniref:MotA/TolQ/ExbB proton channel family protein n=1 Tax=Candidatus Methylobacter oryzae TaxID=2497749 RepID=A0ABY3C6A9_9GAMM|nr:MotA/TolQ/ExbB proton channel family protein [Candidatus Methylobacter oryzae]TRW90630.1 MotA/TolQ/ExbB proton channel family protein [Candidatus Methylobacter oryzae]